MLVSFPDTISQGIFCTRYYTATSSVHPTIYSSAIKQNTGTAVQLHPEFYRFFPLNSIVLWVSCSFPLKVVKEPNGKTMKRCSGLSH